MMVLCNNLSMENPVATSFCSHCTTIDVAIRVPDYPDKGLDWKAVIKYRNRLFIKQLIAYCEDNGIPVTPEERKAAA